MSPSGSSARTLLNAVSCGIDGPRAITVPGSVLALVALLIGTEGITIPPGHQLNPGLAVGSSILAVAIASLVLVAGHRLLHNQAKPGRSAVVGVYLAVGVLHALLIDSLPWMRVSGWRLSEMVAADATLSLLWLSLAAGTLASFDLYRTARGRVVVEEQALTAQRLQTTNEQVEYRAGLDQLVGTTIEPSIDRQLRELDRLENSRELDPSHLRLVAARLRECAESVARHAGHQLWDREPGFRVGSPPGHADTPIRRVSPQWSTRRLILTATRVQPFAPIGSGVLVLLVGLPTLLVEFGWVRGPLAAATVGLLVAGVLAVARVTSTAFLRRTNAPTRILLVLVWYCVAAATGSLGLLLKPAQSYPVWWAWLSQLLVMVIIAAGWASAVAVGQMRHGLEAELAALDATSSWELARAHSELTDMRDRLASCLHGSVQGRLAAAALQLEITAAESESMSEPGRADRCRKALRIVRQALIEGLDDIGAATGGRTQDSIVAELDRIAASWKGAAEVEHAVSLGAVEQVDRMPGLCGAVIGAAEEAVSNAVCHGLARSIDIRIDEGADGVTMTAADDGIGPAGDTAFGYGLRSLENAGESVQLARGEHRGAVLTVHFPVQART